MASEQVEAVIKKAISDDIFRLALNDDLKKTLQSHHVTLTPEELKALQGVDFSKRLPTKRDMVAGTWVHIYKSMDARGTGVGGIGGAGGSGI